MDYVKTLRGILESDTQCDPRFGKERFLDSEDRAAIEASIKAFDLLREASRVLDGYPVNEEIIDLLNGSNTTRTAGTEKIDYRKPSACERFSGPMSIEDES